MAKAAATCRCATCGEEFTVSAYKRNRPEAKNFEEWAAANIDECPACREKRIAEERAREAAQAAEAAGAKGWPELTGSEKQIAWAACIREKMFVDEIDKWSAEFAAKCVPGYVGVYNNLYGDAKMEVLQERTRASWWIDNRSDSVAVWDEIRHKMEENYKNKEEKMAEKEAKSDAATIAKPEIQKHDSVVDIQAADERVSVKYRKDDDFRTVVKGLGYRWDGEAKAWYLQISCKTGTAAERAAELGNKLLNAGFAIRIQDADTLRNAIEGNYAPMHRRWVALLKDGDLYITWARGDDFYRLAKSLPGARYDSPGIRVPAGEWEAVLDFAQAYDFRFTPAAQEIVDEAQTKTMTVKPAASKADKYEEHPVGEILDSNREVLPDLKD